MRSIIALFTLAIAAFLPTDALAWGPGVHLALGNSVLANLGCLPPLVASLIASHPNGFLYGCLSADIFIGKGTSFNPGHSHNWLTGLDLLDSARDSRTKAYAYGYLTHLAADVVAHNYYVPNTMWTMPSGGKLSHVYVEAQADRRFQRERESALALFRRPNRDTDTTLLTTMDRKRLPFLLKKQIVKGTLKVCGLKNWSHSLRLADQILPWSQSDRSLDRMIALSENLVFDSLNDANASVAISFDPIGTRNLRKVRQLRLATDSLSRSSRLFEVHSDISSLPAPGTVTVRSGFKAAG